MKYYCVFLIFCCLGVQSILGRPKLEGREKEIVQKCAQELDIDEEKYDDDLDEYDEDTTCMFACVTRNLAIEALIGPNNTATLHNVSLKTINIAYKAGFDKVSTVFTHQDALDQVEQCYTPESTECTFFKCLTADDAPFNDVVEFVGLKGLQGAIFHVL